MAKKKQNGYFPMLDQAAIRQQLIDTAQEFTRITAMAKSAIGRQALNDTNFLFRVEDGRDFTIQSYQKVRNFLQRNWPRDSVPAPPKKTGGRRAKGK